MNRLERFEQSPLTASSGEFLAGVYGDGATIDAFADSLPENARVIDVGAGLSTFGAEVAARRDDVQWTNYDINYNRTGHVSYEAVRRAVEAAPQNLRFVTGNVLTIPDDMRHAYDRAYSYNLVTHLLRIRRSLGGQALENIVGLLDEHGESKIGPTNAKMATSERWGAATLPADASEAQITAVRQQLTSPHLANWYYRASLSSGVGVYPSGRFAPGESGLVLSDDGGETHHKLLSKRGLALTGRLASGLFRR